MFKILDTKCHWLIDWITLVLHFKTGTIDTTGLLIDWVTRRNMWEKFSLPRQGYLLPNYILRTEVCDQTLHFWNFTDTYYLIPFSTIRKGHCKSLVPRIVKYNLLSTCHPLKRRADREIGTVSHSLCNKLFINSHWNNEITVVYVPIQTLFDFSLEFSNDISL